MMREIHGLLKTFERLGLVKRGELEASGPFRTIYWCRVVSLKGEKYDAKLQAINKKYWTRTW